MNPKQNLFRISAFVLLMWPVVAQADVFVFSDRAAFENALAPDLVVNFVEDFEESTIAPDTEAAFAGPLISGVPNENFPFGLSVPNMRIIALDPNITSFENDLVVLGDGMKGLSSVKIGPRFWNRREGDQHGSLQSVG